MLTSYFLAALAGAITWTFLEYGLHYWLGHLPRGRGVFSREHLKHHADPSYFSPTSSKLATAALLLALVLPPAIWLVGALLGLTYAAAILATYAIYELVHRRMHTHAPPHRFAAYMRRYHLAHHFTAPQKNHGVTTPIWDVVLGTYLPVGTVRVPRRHVVTWLCDEHGAIKPAFQSTYELVGRAGTPAARP